MSLEESKLKTKKAQEQQFKEEKKNATLSFAEKLKLKKQQESAEERKPQVQVKPSVLPPIQEKKEEHKPEPKSKPIVQTEEPPKNEYPF